MAQKVKRLPATWESRVRSLGRDDPLEKEMATHYSIRAWRIPWMEEPGGLQSMGSQRVRHDWATSLSLLTFMHWRRKWQPTPVFLPGEFHGWRSLVGYSPWGHKESDTTERLHLGRYVSYFNKIIHAWVCLTKPFTDTFYSRRKVSDLKVTKKQDIISSITVKGFHKDKVQLQ